MSEKSPEFDPFILNAVYPNAKSLFEFQPASRNTVLEQGLIVVDTNVLVLPYNTGKGSLNAIRKVYTELIKEDRLVVPGRVAREFAKIRPSKLQTLFQQVSRKRDFSWQIQAAHPLLAEIPEYSEVARMEGEISTKLVEYRKAIARVLETMKAWNWDDPVSELYRELFKESVICDPELDEKTVLADLHKRQIHKIPPGYKDAAKDDSGIGDLIIWNTILFVGRERQRDVVFVSGDKKPDWWTSSENEALAPKFELIEEFRHATNGKTLHMVELADLLQAMDVSKEVVKEVRSEQEIERVLTGRMLHASRMTEALVAEKAALRWVMQSHPAALLCELEHSTPDFMLQEPDGRTIAVEVKYFGTTASFYSRNRELQKFLEIHRLGPNNIGYLMAVVADQRIGAALLRALGRAEQHTDWIVVVGMVEAGQFHPYSIVAEDEEDDE